jgi:hypothetical protein
MKEVLSVLVALTFVLSLAAVAPAETKARPAKTAEPAKAAQPAKQAEAKKEKSHQLTGIVEAVDHDAGTLTVKGKKESVSLKVTDPVNLERIRVGDKVFVNYTGDTASSVRKVTEQKAAPGKEDPPKPAEPAGKEMAPKSAPGGKK